MIIPAINDYPKYTLIISQGVVKGTYYKGYTLFEINFRRSSEASYYYRHVSSSGSFRRIPIF